MLPRETASKRTLNQLETNSVMNARARLLQAPTDCNTLRRTCQGSFHKQAGRMALDWQGLSKMVSLDPKFTVHLKFAQNSWCRANCHPQRAVHLVVDEFLSHAPCCMSQRCAQTSPGTPPLSFSRPAKNINHQPRDGDKVTMTAP